MHVRAAANVTVATVFECGTIHVSTVPPNKQVNKTSVTTSYEGGENVSELKDQDLGFLSRAASR